MARRARVRFVSFGRRRLQEGAAGDGPGYERLILRSWTRAQQAPFSPRLLPALRGADVIHCYQYFSLPTFLACLIGRARGARVFVSDLGGGGWTPAYHFDQSRFLAAHLPLSRYAARALPGRNRRFRVIYGGVDLERCAMRATLTHDGSVVFLGRVLPHKGLHFLIAGLPPGTPLHVLGPAPDAAYLEELLLLAAGKPVDFQSGLADAEVVPYLQRAMALVHPTPLDAQGSARAHELFGLAVAEAMACGCPVVASDAASLPEIVADGETGCLVPPGDPAAIAAALVRLRDDAESWRRLAAAGRRRVAERFTWERVVESCLAAYAEAAA